jgi:hypothetical protein
MLLLTAATDAKMRAARHHAFRAITQSALHLATRVLALIFRQRNFCSFCWQQTCYKQCFTIMTRNP